MTTPKGKENTRRSPAGRTGPGCPVYGAPVTGLGEFFSFCSGLSKEHAEFWFRGHADMSWSLTPSALRHDTTEKRDKALNLSRNA